VVLEGNFAQRVAIFDGVGLGFLSLEEGHHGVERGFQAFDVLGELLVERGDFRRGVVELLLEGLEIGEDRLVVLLQGPEALFCAIIGSSSAELLFEALDPLVQGLELLVEDVDLNLVGVRFVAHLIDVDAELLEGKSLAGRREGSCEQETAEEKSTFHRA